MRTSLTPIILAAMLSAPALATDLDNPASDPSAPALGNDAPTFDGKPGAAGEGQSSINSPAGSANAQSSASAQSQRGISPEQARLNDLDGNVRDSLFNRRGAAEQIDKLGQGGFAQFDSDGNGGIAKVEAANDIFVANAMTAYDIDRNGELSESEFEQMTQGLQDEVTARKQAAQDRAEDADSQLRDTFASIDRNDDQILAGHEADSSSGLAERFDETDENSDGFISEAEFARFTEDRSSSLDRDPQ